MTLQAQIELEARSPPQRTFEEPEARRRTAKMAHGPTPIDRSLARDEQMRLNKLIGAKIRTRRHEQNLSLQALAAKLGIGFQQIYKYEVGENLIPACRVVAIAKTLKVKASYFFE